MFKQSISKYLLLTCNNHNRLLSKNIITTSISTYLKPTLHITSSLYHNENNNNNKYLNNFYNNNSNISSRSHRVILSIQNNNNNNNKSSLQIQQLLQQQQQQQQLNYIKRYYNNSSNKRSPRESIFHFGENIVVFVGLTAVAGILYLFLSSFSDLIPFEIISSKVETLLREHEKVNDTFGSDFFFQSFPISQSNDLDKKGDKEFINTNYLIKGNKGQQATVQCKALKKNYYTYEIVLLKVYYGNNTVITVVGEVPIVKTWWKRFLSSFYSHPEKDN